MAIGIHHFILHLTHIKCVVYFDQQMHACACICMVENDKKRYKIIKKNLFSSCVRKAHERLTCASMRSLVEIHNKSYFSSEFSRVIPTSLFSLSINSKYFQVLWGEFKKMKSVSRYRILEYSVKTLGKNNLWVAHGTNSDTIASVPWNNKKLKNYTFVLEVVRSIDLGKI